MTHKAPTRANQSHERMKPTHARTKLTHALLARVWPLAPFRRAADTFNLRDVSKVVKGVLMPDKR